MYKIIKILYAYLPKRIISYLGGSIWLKSTRDLILRPNNIDVIIEENIRWGESRFQFFGPIKIAVKAKQRGIENTLLRHSIDLIDKLDIKECVIIDIGANYGFISLVFQKNIKKELKIIAFEPHPAICKAFNRSILENDITNIKLENMAVGDKDCEIELNLYGQTSNILQNREYVIDKTMIPQINLDQYLSHNNILPNFIKIDVDGYELNVLMGLTETIRKCNPIFVVETNNEISVLDYFQERNYKLLDLHMKEFEGVPDNIFCIPKS